MLEERLGLAKAELNPRIEWWTTGAPVLAASPRSSVLAIAAATQIDLVDVSSFRTLAAVPVAEGPGNFAFSPDGRVFAVDTANGVQLWNVEALRSPLRDVVPQPTIVPRSEGRFEGWTPLGNVLLRRDRRTVLFSPADMRELQSWEDGVHVGALSLDETVVAYDKDGVWSLARRGKEGPHRPLPGQFESFFPDGKSVLTIRDEETFRVSVSSSQAAPLALRLSGGRTDWEPGGRRFALITDDVVELYEVGDRIRQLGRIETKAVRAHFANDGRIVLAVKGGVEVAKVSMRAEPLTYRAQPIRDVAFLGGAEPSLAIAEARTVWVGNAEYVKDIVWESRVVRLAVSPDDGTLAMGTDGGELGVWADGKLDRWRASESEIRDLHWVGDSIWALDAKGVVSRWRAATLQLAMRWRPGVRAMPQRGRRSDDDSQGLEITEIMPFEGKVAYNLDNIGAVAEPGTEPPIAVLDGHADRITAFAVSGNVIATASADRSVRMWPVEPGAPVSEPLVAHYGEVTSLAFVLGGRVLASGGKDGLVWLWSTSGKKLGVLSDGRAAISALAASRDGRRLAVSDASGTVWLWRLGEETVVKGTAELLGTIHTIGKGLVFLTPAGRVSLSGDPEVGRLLGCRLGVVVLPFDVCEGAVSDPGVLVDALR